jgi:hypothetical protein
LPIIVGAEGATEVEELDFGVTVLDDALEEVLEVVIVEEDEAELVLLVLLEIGADEVELVVDCALEEVVLDDVAFADVAARLEEMEAADEPLLDEDDAVFKVEFRLLDRKIVAAALDELVARVPKEVAEVVVEVEELELV